jgi:UPF0755 protein
MEEASIVETAEKKRGWKKIVAGVISLAVLAFCVFYYLNFSAPQRKSEVEQIMVGQTTEEPDLIHKLFVQGYIRSEWAFNYILSSKGWHGKILPGGYRISKSMNAFEVAGVLVNQPYTKWVVISEGLRKEEIADIVAESLPWDENERSAFLNAYKTLQIPEPDGYFFPDTYLIPLNEGGLQVAERLYKHFNEKFAPYYADALQKNIRPETVVKLASILEREGGNSKDMKLISGILWNRLEKGMRLDIDATVQYAKGNADIGWWPKLKSDDKQIDSPFNTYMYAGLPPSPISNPGLTTIDAALNPDKTDCLYYLHDKLRRIHCATTYAEHMKNIDMYLR